MIKIWGKPGEHDIIETTLGIFLVGENSQLHQMPQKA